MLQIAKFTITVFIAVAFMGIVMLALIAAPFKANFVFADGAIGVLVGSIVSSIAATWWAKRNGILTDDNVDKEAGVRTAVE